jgi:hypothetical protein
MTRVCLLSLVLLLPACLERRTLFVEVADGGCPDCAAPDAGAPSREEALAGFAAELVRGPWRGTASVEGVDEVALEMTFQRDGRYVARCLGSDAPDCAPFPGGLVENGVPGEYWLTDRSANGEFWGYTRDTFRSGDAFEGLLDHMNIAGERLTFSRRQQFGIFLLGPCHVVLTREP